MGSGSETVINIFKNESEEKRKQEFTRLFAEAINKIIKLNS